MTYWNRCLFMLAMCCASLPIHAGGYAAVTAGAGEEDYEFYALDAGVDLGESGWSVIVSYFTADDGDTLQYRTGLEWDQSDVTTWSLGISKTEDTQLDIEGYSGGGSWWINPILGGEWGTRLGLEFGYEEYTLHTGRPLVARLANTMPEQNRYSLELTQYLGDSFSIFAGHDEYDYSQEPRVLALLLAQRLRAVNAAITMLSFPERTETLGASWSATTDLAFDLTYSRTLTLIDQELKTTRMGLTWYLNDTWWAGIAASRSRNSEVLGPLGATVVESSTSDYYEASLGVNF